MNKLYRLKTIVFFLFFLLFTSFLFAQKKTYAGLNFVNEISDESSVNTGLGLTIERQFTKHSGIESGVYYRTHRTSFLFEDNISRLPDNFVVAERYISIPFLYKFYSRILNISAGPTFDYFVGWKQKGGIIKLENVYMDPNVGLGFMLKFGKKINLSDHLILEPELRFNPILTFERAYLSLGIAAKYRLKKK